MSKLLIILGIVLILASVPILVVGISSADSSTIGSILEPIVCKPPEKLVTETGTYSDSEAEWQTMTYYCEIEPGQRRDVTIIAVLVIVTSFIIPFGMGMIFIAIGTIRLVRRQTNQFQTDMASYLDAFQQEPGMGIQETTIKLRDNQVTIPPQVQQILNSVLGGVTSAVAQGQAGNSLSERLVQLDEAYENDLITREEYDKVRQAILDSMDD